MTPFKKSSVMKNGFPSQLFHINSQSSLFKVKSIPSEGQTTMERRQSSIYHLLFQDGEALYSPAVAFCLYWDPNSVCKGECSKTAPVVVASFASLKARLVIELVPLGHSILAEDEPGSVDASDFQACMASLKVLWKLFEDTHIQKVAWDWELFQQAKQRMGLTDTDWPSVIDLVSHSRSPKYDFGNTSSLSRMTETFLQCKLSEDEPEAWKRPLPHEVEKLKEAELAEGGNLLRVYPEKAALTEQELKRMLTKAARDTEFVFDNPGVVEDPGASVSNGPEAEGGMSNGYESDSVSGQQACGDGGVCGEAHSALPKSKSVKRRERREQQRREKERRRSLASAHDEEEAGADGVYHCQVETDGETNRLTTVPVFMLGSKEKRRAKASLSRLQEAGTSRIPDFHNVAVPAKQFAGSLDDRECAKEQLIEQMAEEHRLRMKNTPKWRWHESWADLSPRAWAVKQLQDQEEERERKDREAMRVHAQQREARFFSRGKQRSGQRGGRCGISPGFKASAPVMNPRGFSNGEAGLRRDRSVEGYNGPPHFARDDREQRRSVQARNPHRSRTKSPRCIGLPRLANEEHLRQDAFPEPEPYRMYTGYQLPENLAPPDIPMQHPPGMPMAFSQPQGVVHVDAVPPAATGPTAHHTIIPPGVMMPGHGLTVSPGLPEPQQVIVVSGNEARFVPVAPAPGIETFPANTPPTYTPLPTFSAGFCDWPPQATLSQSASGMSGSFHGGSSEGKGTRLAQLAISAIRMKPRR